MAKPAIGSLEVEEKKGPEHGFWGTVGWGVAYFFCSASMLLANKVALYMVPIPALICGIQYVFCLLVCECVSALGAARVDAWSKETVRAYWLVPCFFTLAIFSNNKVLQYANVETFIVFRNTTPVFVCLLDFLVLKKALPSWRTVFSFVFIVGGTIVYSVTDDKFRPVTSLWIAVYLIVISGEMVYVKHIFTSVPMSTWSRVKYTNGLSLLLQPFLVILTQEWLTYKEIKEISAFTVFIVFLSCLGGLGISFSGTEFRSRVGATTFTVVGVVNKMLTVTVNYFMWDQHAHVVGLAALSFTILGGVLYQPPLERESGSFSEKVWKFVTFPCRNDETKAKQASPRT